MNGIRKRIEEIEAGGVDEQEKLRELEIAIARFETVLHRSNEDVKAKWHTHREERSRNTLSSDE